MIPRGSIVNEREERLEQTGILAEAADAIVATLAARLDVLLASWQRAVEAEGKAPLRPAKVKRRVQASLYQ